MLRGAADDARGGIGRVVLVEGEPGIGKTRLTSELVHELLDADEQVASGHGIDLTGGELAYGVASELLRDLAYRFGDDHLRDLLGAHATALTPLHPPLYPGPSERSAPDPVPVDRASIFAAFHSLLLGLTQDRLLCVSVDDLQWVDASSLDLLTYLAKVSGRSRFLLVCTVRSSPRETDRISKHLADLARLPGSLTLTLSALDDRQVAEVIRGAVDDPVDPDLVREVQRLSEGVPLYVEELLAASEATLPTSLRTNLAIRLAGLTDDELGYLQTAAVGTGYADPSLVAQVSGLSTTAVALADREATARGLLDPRPDSEPVRFHHDLLRHAVLDTLLSTRSRELHRRWAEALDEAVADSSSAEAIAARASHWSEAGEPDRALSAALAAADAARQRGGFTECVHWQQRALALWSAASDPENRTGISRIDLALDTILGLTDVGEWDTLIAVAQDELARLSDDDWLAALTLRLTLAFFPAWRDGAAEPALVFEPVGPTIDAVLAEPTSRLSVFCMFQLLAYRLYLPNYLEPQLVAKISAALDQQASELGDRQSLRSALRIRGLLALEAGDADAVLAVVRDVLEVEPQPGPMTLGGVIWLLLSVGRYQESVSLGDLHGDLRAEPAAVLLWHHAADNVAYSLFAIGDWDRCHDLIRTIIDVMPAGQTSGTSRALLARLAAARGDIEVAREQVEIATEVLPAIGSAGSSLGFTAQPAIEAAHLALVTGDAERAFELLMPVLDDPDAAIHSAVTFEAVLFAAQALSRLPSAPPAWAELVTESAARLQSLSDVGRAWRLEVACRLADRDGDEDAAGWAEVVDAWRVADFVYHRVAAQLELARALLRAGDRDAAATELDDGFRSAHTLGAAPLAEQFRRLARSGRIRLGDETSATVPAAARRLTARETEVLGLIALGHSNQQIAAELFMSPKTASVHVSRIIQKLGVANRTEAAAYAHRHGLAPER